jgi:hypothetical protein
LAVVFAVLVISSGVTPTVAEADTGSIYEWVREVSDDGSKYGIDSTDVVALFSGDDDSYYAAVADTVFSGNISNDEFEKRFYQIGDFTYAEPSEAVEKWNQNNVKEFSAGGRGESVFPYGVRDPEEFTDSNYIKDAHVTFYSVDPSTTVLSASGTASQEIRVGREISVRGVHSNRLEKPDPRFENDPSKKQKVRLEDYDVTQVRLLTDACDSPDECVLDTTSKNHAAIRFNDVFLPKQGVQTLTLEVTYHVEYERVTYERDKICLGFGWDTYCSWGKFVVKDTSISDDSVTVTDTFTVNSTLPTATAVKADLPGRADQYHVTGLEYAEWRKLSYTVNGNEFDGVRSNWRFFSSRDQRWDVHCEVDGSGFSGNIGGRCGGYINDAQPHKKSDARPLYNFATPGVQYSQTPLGGVMSVVAEPTTTTNGYPQITTHEVCEDECEWNFVLYQNLTEDGVVPTHTDATSLVVEVPETVEGLFVHGMVDGSEQQVVVTDTVEVREAVIRTKVAFEGDDLPAGLTSGAANMPSNDEVQMLVQLYDGTTGEPIDLTDRDDEYIKISDGASTYYAVPGTDGTVTVNLKRTDGPYRFTYVNQPWWELPSGQQAYSTAGPTVVMPEPPSLDGTYWFAILNAMLMIGMVMVIINTVLYLAGSKITIMSILRLFKQEFWPF